ncbi:PilZ domain-containing protein [Thiomicrorhabdus arctica]|jgi:hypothetical protein|uniref:PilZ domain-containing protein n=1 Tax=Thiomicrorhabdus arctica TaxID=131540 RepID=UPI0003632F17|nr:PilZ domain-containing protein [Thiomicrorhabdus arctica]
MDKITPLIENSAFSNRRRENRLPSHIPSLLIQHDKAIYTTVVNLSSTGIGFLSAVKVPSDEEVMITFERLEADVMVPVKLKVHVRSCHEVDDEYYIGGSLVSNSLNYTKFFKLIEPHIEP